MNIARPARVVVIGATSSIAAHVARIYASRRATFYLVGRQTGKLRVVGDDLTARGGTIVGITALEDRHEAHETIAEGAITALGGVDLVLIAQGVLGEQKRAEADAQEMARIFTVNTIDTLAWATVFGNALEAHRGGTLAVISSVAGDLGRRSNYVYGASKAAINTFMSGMTVRLMRAGAQGCTIKPGPVATPMTEGLDKLPLLATPADVAATIVRGLDRRRPVIYAPGLWRWIMLVLQHLPLAVLRRLNF